MIPEQRACPSRVIAEKVPSENLPLLGKSPQIKNLQCNRNDSPVNITESLDMGRAKRTKMKNIYILNDLQKGTHTYASDLITCAM